MSIKIIYSYSNQLTQNLSDISEIGVIYNVAKCPNYETGLNLMVSKAPLFHLDNFIIKSHNLATLLLLWNCPV